MLGKLGIGMEESATRNGVSVALSRQVGAGAAGTAGVAGPSRTHQGAAAQAAGRSEELELRQAKAAPHSALWFD